MKNNIRNGKATTLLRKLGANPANLGWKYIEEATYLVIEDPTMLNMITKRLYPAIAELAKICDKGGYNFGHRREGSKLLVYID